MTTSLPDRTSGSADGSNSDEDYFRALCKAMQSLSGLPQCVFLGQGVGVPGTSMSRTLEAVDPAKRLEVPVAEDMQLGMAIGMSLYGLLPICIFPRWNFVLRAADQLVNHLDRLSIYGNGYAPKVIIRVAVPSTDPFDPGPQHDDDFTVGFELMLRRVRVRRLESDAVLHYRWAVDYPHSCIMVEYTDLYRNARASE